MSRKKILLTLSVITLSLFNGCCYLTKQGAGLVRYQSRTVRIDKMLRDDGLTPETRDFLQRALDIRAFAMDSIGLKRNKNYTKYVRIDRDYMVDVVVACRDDTFDLYKWWFPVIGKTSYKGFFNRNDAEKEARKIEKRGGYDTYIGRADAFSTLGVFADPIYSFMINYNIYDLASLIIHEQTHATIYIKNQTQLSEEMASFVGDVGGLWYMRNKFGEDSELYRAAVLSKDDYTTYINLMRKLYEDLRAIYERESSREEKLAEKERMFDVFRNNIANSYDSLFKTPRYHGLKQAKLNNAHIAARMTYNLDMSLYYDLYDRLDGDLAAVVGEFKGLKKIKKGHKEHLKTRPKSEAKHSQTRK